MSAYTLAKTQQILIARAVWCRASGASQRARPPVQTPTARPTRTPTAPPTPGGARRQGSPSGAAASGGASPLGPGARRGRSRAFWGPIRAHGVQNHEPYTPNHAPCTPNHEDSTPNHEPNTPNHVGTPKSARAPSTELPPPKQYAPCTLSNSNPYTLFTLNQDGETHPRPASQADPAALGDHGARAGAGVGGAGPALFRHAGVLAVHALFSADHQGVCGGRCAEMEARPRG